MQIQTETTRVLKLPADKIVCARQFPMTEETSQHMRTLREYFTKQIKESGNQDVSLPMPTVLAFAMKKLITDLKLED